MSHVRRYGSWADLYSDWLNSSRSLLSRDGIAVKRSQRNSQIYQKPDNNRPIYGQAGDKFKMKTKWKTVARQNVSLYHYTTEKEKTTAGRS